jgi:hypothetical protein
VTCNNLTCKDCNASFLFKNFETNELIEYQNLTSTNLKFYHSFNDSDICGIYQLNITIVKEGFESENSSLLTHESKYLN